MKSKDSSENQIYALIKWTTSEGDYEIILQYDSFWDGDLQKYIDSNFYTVEILRDEQRARN